MYDTQNPNDNHYYGSQKDHPLHDLHTRLFTNKVRSSHRAHHTMFHLLGTAAFAARRLIAVSFPLQYPHPKPKGSDVWEEDSMGAQFDNVYYLILCRVALGMPAYTKDSDTTISGGPVWARKEKVLATIPNVPGAPIHYHSLIAEKGPGCKVQRHREFILFRDEPSTLALAPRLPSQFACLATHHLASAAHSQFIPSTCSATAARQTRERQARTGRAELVCIHICASRTPGSCENEIDPRSIGGQ